MRWCCRASSRSATSTRTSSLSPTRASSSPAQRRSTFRHRLGELERRLTLAQLVAAWAKGPVLSPLVVGGPASTLALAGDLARLIDDMVTRGVDWSALDGLVPDMLDRYWQHSLEFLRIARNAWPGSSRRDQQDRARGAARSPDRGGSQAADRASPWPRDRGGLDRLDAGDRKIPACGRIAAAWRRGAAGPRHRSRRRRLAAASAACATRTASSPSIRPRTIRNMPCMRCWSASASSAATSRCLGTPAPRRPRCAGVGSDAAVASTDAMARPAEAAGNRGEDRRAA